MNINLLSQVLVLVLAVISTSLSTYLVMNFFKFKTRAGKLTKKDAVTRKKYIWSYVLAIFASCLLDAIIVLIFEKIFDSQLPLTIFVMLLPFTLSIALLILVIIYKRQLWIKAAVCMVFSLVLSLVLINGYYELYSNVGQLFDNNGNSGSYINSKDNKSRSSTDQFTLESGLDLINKQSKKGSVYSLNIPGTKSKFKPRTAYVYIPSSYKNLPDTSFPVIVLTAGFPGKTDNWLDSGLEATMDEFASLHDGVTPLVFMVDNTGSITNDTECVNSPRGNIETYLTSDVPIYIKNHFRVSNSPSQWAIGGLSMGGMCSIMLTLRHTNVYHYFMDYGGEIGPEVGSMQTTINTLFSGSLSAWQSHQPSLLLNSDKYKKLGLGGFFGYGNRDSSNVTLAINQLIKQSKSAGIDTQLEVVSGSHTFAVWQELFKDSLPFISNKLGATKYDISQQN